MKIRIDRIFQKETAMIDALKKTNCINLYKELKPSAYKTFVAIDLYFADLLYSQGYRWRKFQDKEAKISSLRKTNKIKITYDLLKEYEGACVHKEEKKARYNTKQQLKVLQNERVLYALGNEEFIINPHFIYVGDECDNCYFEWCRITGEEYNTELADATRWRYSVKGKRSVQAASRAMIDLAKEMGWVKDYNPECDLPEDIIERLNYAYNQAEKEEPIVLEPEYFSKQEILEKYDKDRRNILWYNQRIIEELGVEDAEKVINPIPFKTALKSLEK